MCKLNGDLTSQGNHRMKCSWMTERSLDTADPQNRSEWIGRLRKRLVKQAQPSEEDDGL